MEYDEKVSGNDNLSILTRLNPEIIYEVVQYLDIVDLITVLRKTCKYLKKNSPMQEHPHRAVKFNQFSIEQLKHAISSLNNVYEKFLSIDFSFNFLITAPYLEVLPKPEFLEEINVSETDISLSQLLSLNSRRLKKIIAWGESENITKENWEKVARLPSLQLLDVSDKKFNNDPEPNNESRLTPPENKQFQSLRTLRLNCSEVPGEFLENIKSAYNLIEINLTNNPEVFDSHMRNLSELVNLEKLILNETGVTETGFSQLYRLQSLTNLGLSGMNFTNAGFSIIRGFSQLKTLDISDSNAPDRALRDLAHLPLQSLDLSGTDITDEGMGDLNNIPTLQFLDISRTNITNEGLARLNTLQHLKKLNLSATDISSEGLRHLIFLSSLTELDVSETQITDYGLRYLTQLMSLKYLILSKTNITNEGLVHVANMSFLNRLVLNETNITPDDLITSVSFRNLRSLVMLHQENPLSQTQAAIFLRNNTNIHSFYFHHEHLNYREEINAFIQQHLHQGQAHDQKQTGPQHNALISNSSSTQSINSTQSSSSSHQQPNNPVIPGFFSIRTAQDEDDLNETPPTLSGVKRKATHGDEEQNNSKKPRTGGH